LIPALAHFLLDVSKRKSRSILKALTEGVTPCGGESNGKTIITASKSRTGFTSETTVNLYRLMGK
jgi:hypothetical protein